MQSFEIFLNLSKSNIFRVFDQKCKHSNRMDVHNRSIRLNGIDSSFHASRSDMTQGLDRKSRNIATTPIQPRERQKLILWAQELQLDRYSVYIRVFGGKYRFLLCSLARSVKSLVSPRDLRLYARAFKIATCYCITRFDIVFVKMTQRQISELYIQKARERFRAFKRERETCTYCCIEIREF